MSEERIYLFDRNDYLDIEQSDDWKEMIEEEQGMPLEDISEDDIWTFLSRMEEIDYEDEKANIQAAIGNNRIIAHGTAGTWLGEREGGFIASDIQDAIWQISGNDYGDIGFYVENGELHLTFTHHDGTHDLLLRKITDAGEDYIINMEYELAEQDIEKDVFSNPMYSTAINVLGS